MTRETLVSKAYRLIKQDILTGRIPVDTIFSERTLSVQYGLSRTPLRTAFLHLETEGIISRLNGGVLLVKSVTAEQFLEIVDLRKPLEVAAAARAAKRGLSPELRELEAEMQAFASNRHISFDEFWAHDDRFHAAVARAAGLHLLLGIIGEQRATARRCTIAQRLDQYSDQVREHQAVIDAIEEGNPEDARAAMSLHFDNIRRRFLASLSDH